MTIIVKFFITDLYIFIFNFVTKTYLSIFKDILPGEWLLSEICLYFSSLLHERNCWIWIAIIFDSNKGDVIIILISLRYFHIFRQEYKSVIKCHTFNSLSVECIEHNFLATIPCTSKNVSVLKTRPIWRTGWAISECISSSSAIAKWCAAAADHFSLKIWKENYVTHFLDTFTMFWHSTACPTWIFLKDIFREIKVTNSHIVTHSILCSKWSLRSNGKEIFRWAV